MVATYSYDDPDSDFRMKFRRTKNVKIDIYDGEIDPTSSKLPCSVESTANGGIKIKVENEDELGYESTLEVVLDRHDLEVIQSLKNQGLI